MFQKLQRPGRATDQDSSLSEGWDVSWEDDLGGDEERTVPLSASRPTNSLLSPIAEMERKIAMIASKVEDLEAENKSLKSQMIDMRAENARMKEENKHLSARMSALVGENEDLRRQNQMANSIAEGMRGHMATLEEENRRLRTESQVRDEKIAQLGRALGRKDTDIGTIIDSVALIQAAQMPLVQNEGVFNTICGWLISIWNGISSPFTCLFEAIYCWLKNSQVEATYSS
jgi:hypothetical protein